MGMRVIKAMPVSDAGSLERLNDYADSVDMFLLDTASPLRGGTGRKFDWNLLDSYDLKEDFMLSGGISPDDAERLRPLKHPRLAAIDLNSRFESEPGIKDISLLLRFINKLKSKES